MSLEVQVTFTTDCHHEAWDAIGALLQQGSVGARLQDAFEVFGEETGEQLEELLEAFPAELLYASGYSRSGDQVVLEFEWPGGEPEFPEAFKKLLKHCGAQAIQLRSVDLSGD